MGKIFYNKVDLKNGKVYSLFDLTKELGINNKGYKHCFVKDKFGNSYHGVHEVIYAEGTNTPKHLWPVDENGRRYEIDHIKPINNGGTDEFQNLRLVSRFDNMNNELSKVNMSISHTGKKRRKIDKN